MKKQILIAVSLFLGLVYAISSCSSTRNANENVVNKVMEDHESAGYTFPEGIFYTYQFETDKPAYDFDVEALIEKLAAEDIPVKNLWYKAASSSCVPPGSSMGMSVMVDAVLIVQTSEKTAALGGLGFQRITAASMGNCAYRVSRYIFTK